MDSTRQVTPISSGVLITTKEDDPFGILGYDIQLVENILENLYERENRIQNIDGVSQVTTMDYVPGRINLHIKDGKVVAFEVEK